MKKNRCDGWTDKQWSSYWLPEGQMKKIAEFIEDLNDYQ